MKYSKYSKKNGFFAGKGFYLALAGCVAAIGIAAWSAMASVSTAEDKASQIKPSSRPEADAGKTISGVADDRLSSFSILSSEPESSSAPQSGEESSEPAETAPAERYFVLPVKGGVGKGYSDTALQRSATFGDMRLHTGVDLQAPKGSAVVSAASGKVTAVSDDGLWGRIVVIDHGEGIVCRYCGLENTTVSAGEEISAGTQIGEVGTVPCECADEPHVHLAFTKNGENISPFDLIKIE